MFKDSSMEIDRHWINAAGTMKALLTKKLAPCTLDRLVRVNADNFINSSSTEVYLNESDSLS